MSSSTRFESQSLADWLNYILSVHPAEIEMGLTRLIKVATDMGLASLPHSKVVTVAGTNGKGSTCAMMESVLRQAGISTGVFSSPHLHRYNERVRINGRELEDRAHIDAFRAIEQARGETQLTFFEFSALGALYLFAEQRPEVVLLEVGLGGRLDATNLIDADLAVITSIDLDHQEYLGNTRESVGREKAGIFRPRVPAVIGEPDLPGSVVEVAGALGTPLLCVGRDFHGEFRELGWHFQGARWRLEALPTPSLPQVNAVTALAALEQLRPELPEEAVRAGLAEASLPGRMQLLSDEPRVYADVAHNPHAARYLAQRLSLLRGKGRVLAVCAMLEDKEIELSLSALMPVVDHWFAAPLPVPRGGDGQRVARAAGIRGVEPSLAAALSKACDQAGDLDLVIVFGSFYTVAEAQSLFEGE
ncbi:bifunctional tetrahydrofolate synthase/dihydrofolate synthase [Ferrimonas sediminicola]|uniref:Dihydrofolate synthase/folylpolyglutamate synthase n=1 Tax=Ferrimonas sediminicola TaxID=2569538 RepID=A0A4U1BGK9_9GAMM|nr:bifunctional tetrahydrofolate synthase/dihydrofolate synthase [Ferrimonas sediminicola]TKB49852.1 bifunctional tetrahydrofolate synthase/dihydrofolate synthase [Ferrimonas sediminicola]